MTMRVGLMIHELNDRNAIGRDIVGMFSALTASGVETIIFTASGEAQLPLQVMHYRDAELLFDNPDDTVIYHLCADDPAGREVLQRIQCRILVRYHNLDIPSVMSRWSSELGRSTRLARQMLIDVVDSAVDGFLVDCVSNKTELLGLGVRAVPIFVAPRLHDCDELLAQAGDASTGRLLETHAYNVLAVGKLVPDKAFDVMMESFGKALAWGGLDIHLHHVGHHDPRLQQYTDKIVDTLVRNGAMPRFTFYGHVGMRALATLYRGCDLFWTTSTNEGFCLPAVEAMAFGLPILSSRNSALSETCGDAAIYADTEDEFAIALHRILADDFTRLVHGRRGQLRYKTTFRPAQLRRRFLAGVETLTTFAAHRESAISLDRSGDWFGLPRHDVLLDIVLSLSPAQPAYGLSGQDRRMDIIDRGFRDETGCDALAAYLGSTDLLDYARELEMPQAGRYLAPDLRLVWTFNRSVKSRFDLQGPESVAEFYQWFEREGVTRYAPLVASIRSRCTS